MTRRTLNNRWNPRNPDVDRFTRGDCHVLARYLARRLGLPVSSFNGDMHVFVRLPNGLILDVEGLWTERAFRKHWSTGHRYPPITVQSPSECAQHWRGMWSRRASAPCTAFGSYSYERARIVGDQLLEHYGLA